MKQYRGRWLGDTKNKNNPDKLQLETKRFSGLSVFSESSAQPVGNIILRTSNLMT